MNKVRAFALSIAALLILHAGPAVAQDNIQNKIKVVATFSILGDLAKNIGGDRIGLTTLVGPNGDAHVYSPTPADVRKIGEAKLVLVNGFGFEGWIARLTASSATKAAVVVVSNEVQARRMDDEHHPGKKVADPHAWQSVANAKLYVANIRDALAKADPSGKAAYEANAAAYLAKLDALDREIRDAIGKIPSDRRRIITTHDAFGYFSAAYGLEFVAPSGVSTETDMSARDVARIINQIKKQKIPAVFIENISDPRAMQQIGKETGARIGGTLYSDALSDTTGPAATYIDMMRHNIRQLSAALAS